MKIQNKKLALIGIGFVVLAFLGPLSQGVWQMFLILAAVGLLLVFQSRKPPNPKKKRNEHVNFDFPEFDSDGHKRLAIIQTVLSGITHEHFGYDPQNTIPSTDIGDQIILHPDKDNQYDRTAVWASTTKGEFLGWIPSGSNAELFQRLIDGHTVYARVKRKDFVGLDEETATDEEKLTAPLGIVIEIARYAKN